MEEGTPFCKHCNAPQIRVATPEDFATLPNSVVAAYHDPTRIDWAKAFPGIVTSGIVSAMLMVIPPLGAFGLGMIAAGILAVILYRRAFAAEITPGMGAKLGIATGGIGFAIVALFTAIQLLIFHSGSELRDAMLQAVEQAASRNPDPQAQQLLTYLKTPEGLGIVMALSLSVMLVGFLIFSSAGGALGAILLRPKKPNNNRF